MTEKVNLIGLDRLAMQTLCAEMGEKTFRAQQILQWIYRHGVTDFDAMTNLAKSCRQQLAERCEINMPTLGSPQISADGTQKWLLQLAPNNAIETAYIPETTRDTLCISSQIGCPLDCAFCSTAQQGFNRNLTAAEIVAQIWRANQCLGRFACDQRFISNIVFMGMGEPLLNYANVMCAVRLLLDDHAFGLSARRITLSTAGVVPGIDKLAQEQKIGLAISLHATDNALRDKLVPLNRHYPIEDVLAACKRYARAQATASITIEYVMLAGVNDSLREARALVRLLSDLPVKINLIPFNPFPATIYRRSSLADIDAFRSVLQAAGLVTITRKTRGEDINAACGQLAGQVVAKQSRRQALSATT